MQPFHLHSLLSGTAPADGCDARGVVIGITGNFDEGQLKLLPGYFRSIEQAGGIPLVIPPRGQVSDEVIVQLLERIDGLLLSGGADLNPLWGDKLGAWLAKEWNATVVQTFQGATPYTEFDTSSEEAMLFGLARRNIAEVPMIRQGRGWVDVFEEDVTSLINDYNINAVVFPGHMGHKDQSGTGVFLKRICRDLDVPCITLTTSLFDERYTSLDKVQNDLSNFFSAVGFKRNKA